MTKHEISGLLVAFVAVAYVGCGRNELDDGIPITGVETGSGGSVPTGNGGNYGSGGVTGSGGVKGQGGTGGGAGTGGRGGSGGQTGSGGRAGSGGSIGSGGSGGRSGSGGSGAGNGIACGQMTCQPGVDTCCIQLAGGRRSESCIPAGTTCQGGASVGCVGGDCAAGRVCCFSLINLATSCTAPPQCASGLSTVLCGSDADCPATRSHCCQGGGINICQSTCGGGRPGGGGPGAGPAPTPN